MKKNRIINCIRGGCTQEVYADSSKNIEIVLFDVDNLQAKGVTNDQIQKDWKKLTKGTELIF
jgi:hypothetical protein